MANEKQSSPSELFDAEAHVLNNMYSFVNTMCLKSALELNIPDIIHKHGKAMTLAELTKALPVNKSKSLCIDRLMRVLVHANFFTKVKISEEDTMGFMLTPAYRHFLTRDGDLNIISLVLSLLDHDFIDPWYNMTPWFQNDHPTPFWTCHGRTLWDHLRMNPRLSYVFNEGMATDTRLVSRVIPKDCKEAFEGLEVMVDVGGGTGYMAKAISDEFPGLKCVVLDLPQVVDGLKGNDKVAFIGGNMFESLPPCDAVFLKWILHNWNDEDCLKILKKCKEAVHTSKNKGGKVIIIDMVVSEEQEADDHKALETQLFFDMTMMVWFCGKERTEKDWANLFSEAGFTSYKISPLLGIRSLIEVFP